MGISTGQRHAYHAWYHAVGPKKFWDPAGRTRAFAQHMPPTLLPARFEWVYEGDSKVFKAVKNSSKFPVPAILDFTAYDQQAHILANPLDPSQMPLSEHLVCVVKSMAGNGGLFDGFVKAELGRYGAPADPYTPADKHAKSMNVASVSAVPAAAPAAAAAAAPPPAVSRRFEHHLQFKHSQSYQRHLGALQTQVAKQMVTRQQMTEVRGEFAAAKFAFLVLAKSVNDYHLKLGMNSPYVQGVDQIWARRDTAGNVREYVLVEAKGSRGARLGDTATKGFQMSPQWAMASIVELHERVATMKANGNPFADSNLESLTTKIMKSMLGLPPDPRFPGHVPEVWGLIVHLQFSNPKPTYLIQIRDAGVFNVDN